MNMKKLLCLFLISIFVCSVGCIGLKKETQYYDIENDYIKLEDYVNKIGGIDSYLKYLGKDIADKDIPENQFVTPSVRIYSMSNLPADDYIYRIESDFITSSREQYMKKDVEEPILRYPIYEIEIFTNIHAKDPALILKDQEIINALQTIRREGDSIRQEILSIKSKNYVYGYCILDLRQFSRRYGLTYIYTSRFDFDNPEHIQWICFDSKDGCLYTYDVTEILSDYYNEHRDVLMSSSENG